jgi:hypothetical protein
MPSNDADQPYGNWLRVVYPIRKGGDVRLGRGKKGAQCYPPYQKDTSNKAGSSNVGLSTTMGLTPSGGDDSPLQNSSKLPVDPQTVMEHTLQETAEEHSIREMVMEHTLRAAINVEKQVVNAENVMQVILEELEQDPLHDFRRKEGQKRKSKEVFMDAVARKRCRL